MLLRTSLLVRLRIYLTTSAKVLLWAIKWNFLGGGALLILRSFSRAKTGLSSPWWKNELRRVLEVSIQLLITCKLLTVLNQLIFFGWVSSYCGIITLSTAMLSLISSDFLKEAIRGCNISITLAHSRVYLSFRSLEVPLAAIGGGLLVLKVIRLWLRVTWAAGASRTMFW